MLLHIVDISDVDHKTKIIEVNNILEELGVNQISPKL
jgi:50S ribosomal subunit-associated GTPase HflX